MLLLFSRAVKMWVRNNLNLMLVLRYLQQGRLIRRVISTLLSPPAETILSRFWSTPPIFCPLKQFSSILLASLSKFRPIWLSSVTRGANGQMPSTYSRSLRKVYTFTWSIQVPVQGAFDFKFLWNFILIQLLISPGCPLFRAFQIVHVTENFAEIGEEQVKRWSRFHTLILINPNCWCGQCRSSQNGTGSLPVKPLSVPG